MKPKKNMDFFAQKKFVLPAGTLIKIADSAEDSIKEYLFLLEKGTFIGKKMKVNPKLVMEMTWSSEQKIKGRVFWIENSKRTSNQNFYGILVLLKEDSIFLP